MKKKQHKKNVKNNNNWNNKKEGIRAWCEYTSQMTMMTSNRGTHTTFTYENKQAKAQNSSAVLCTWPFTLAATSLITFEAWLHWKANHVPSNCLCATRLNFIWLVTSRPFTTLTESVLYDAWFSLLAKCHSFGMPKHTYIIPRHNCTLELLAVWTGSLSSTSNNNSSGTQTKKHIVTDIFADVRAAQSTHIYVQCTCVDISMCIARGIGVCTA